MSLTFTDNTSDRLSLGTSTAFNDDTSTWMMWCYPTSMTFTAFSLAELFARPTVASAGRDQLFLRSNGTLGLWTDYVTTDMKLESNTGLVVASAWQFLAATRNGVTATSNHLYRGTLTASATEPTYAVTQDGVGAHNPGDDNLYIGNFSPTLAATFVGHIAWAGVWNRVMTLGEIQEQQFWPHVTTGCLGFWHLGYTADTATQPDWSGNGNAGTPTGLAKGPHVPLRAPWGIDRLWSPYRVTAAGVTYPQLERGIRGLERGVYTGGSR